MNAQQKTGFLFSIGGLAVGLCLGWGLKGWMGLGEASFGHALRDFTIPYKFVKPLFACSIGATTESATLNDLRSAFNQDIDNAIRNDRAESVSVYFKNLDEGDWTSVNGDDAYTPASLAKVPLLIAALKQAESDPTFLARTLVMKTLPSADAEQEVPPAQTLEIGKSYTIDDLLRLMIVYSDNRATRVLMSTIDQETLKEVFTDLEVPEPDTAGNYTISARVYTRFFRILYNGTFLTAEMSEKALALLADADYDDGLRAGVDENVPISRKFGELATKEEDGTITRELHDCGLVYTKEPYAICVMTKGEDLDALASVIADISKTAYTYKIESK